MKQYLIQKLENYYFNGPDEYSKYSFRHIVGMVLDKLPNSWEA